MQKHRDKDKSSNNTKKRKLAPGETPSIAELSSDRLTKLQARFWSGNEEKSNYDGNVVEDIYYKELMNSDVGSTSSVILERSSYLELYLWKHLDISKTSYAHVMSLLMLLNQKFHDNLDNVWESQLCSDKEKFTWLLQVYFAVPSLFESVDNTSTKMISKPKHEAMLPREYTHWLYFLNHVFTSLDVPEVRAACMLYCSLPLWGNLTDVNAELQDFPEYAKTWKKVSKNGFEKYTHAKDLVPGIIKTMLQKQQYLSVEYGKYVHGEVLLWESQVEALPAWEQESIHVGFEALDRKAPLKVKKMKRKGKADAVELKPASVIAALLLSAEFKAVEVAMQLCIALISQVNTRMFCLPVLQQSWVAVHCLYCPIITAYKEYALVQQETIQRYDLVYKKAKELKMQLLTLKKQTLQAKASSMNVQNSSSEDTDSSDSSSSSESEASDSNSEDDTSANTSNNTTATLPEKIQQVVNAYREQSSILQSLRKPRVSNLLDPARLITSLSTLFFYMRLGVDKHTGKVLSRVACDEQVEQTIRKYQRKAFTLQNKFFALVSSYELMHPSLCWAALEKEYSRLDSGIFDIQLYHPMLQLPFTYDSEEYLKFIASIKISMPTITEELITRTCITLTCARPLLLNELEQINIMPTEELCFNRQYAAENSILPRKTLQYLNLQEYVLHSLTLHQLEAAYVLRNDFDIYFKACHLKLNTSSNTVEVLKKSNFVSPILNFEINKVGPCKVSSVIPSYVKGHFDFSLMDSLPQSHSYWNGLVKGDTMYLMELEFVEGHKRPIVKTLRSCWVDMLLDDSGNAVTRDVGKGVIRRVVFQLDPSQYYTDTQGSHIDSLGFGADLVCGFGCHLSIQSSKTADPMVYSRFHVVVRRNTEENTFRSLLEGARDLLQNDQCVPEILVGAVTGQQVKTDRMPLKQLQLVDTFVSAEHLEAVLGVKPVSNEHTQSSSYKLHWEDAKSTPTVEAFTPILPYNTEKRRNTIPFTTTQVQAILTGMNPGLSLVVGPPGTGKTDVAVQQLSELYHHNPTERVLVLTHSNAALNDIFSKLLARDVDPRYVVRLGNAKGVQFDEDYAQKTQPGYFQMNTINSDFSRQGRVEYMLQRRKQLLEEVQQYADCLGVGGEVSGTCDLADKFYNEHVHRKLDAKPYPFQSLINDDVNAIESHKVRVIDVFVQLKETIPFEMFRYFGARAEYLVSRHARVLAMTCTHAQLHRKHFQDIHMQFSTIIVEEAGQIADLESVLPFSLQSANPEFGHRLKRVVMFGDHNQLPPIIQNGYLMRSSNQATSFFARQVKLHANTLQLDAQGRSRACLADLWRWKYSQVQDLDLTSIDNRFSFANCGFQYPYQFIDMEEYGGETQPQPHVIQNQGEAEYLVHLYMYMRIMGIAAKDITILTAYHGQKCLIEEMLLSKVGKHPFFGLPATVSTIDKYQGQQNNYILLSLVRTKQIGYLRDVRRFIVAMSRARLGLYIVGKRELFTQCFDQSYIMMQLTQYPAHLMLVPSERNIHGLTSRPEQTADISTLQVFTIQNLQHIMQVITNMKARVDEEYIMNTITEKETDNKDQKRKHRSEEDQSRIEAELERATRLLEKDAEMERETERYNQELQEDREMQE